jgi:DNA (cytosine-5)-methyltransferase 1
MNGKKVKVKKKNLVSLFSGCGGMDIGFEGNFKIPKVLLNGKLNSDWIEKEDSKYIYLKETIFETVFANDISEFAKYTWDDYFLRKKGKNFKDVFKVESIVDIVKEYKNGNKNLFPNKVHVVTGGFPCQDFSVAGKRKGFNSHKDHNGKLITEEIPTIETRGQLYMWMREVIQITKPNIFIAENVKGLSNLGEVKKIIQNDFSNGDTEEYIVLNPRVLHSGNFGVPQSRERIIFIGFKKSSLSENALKILSQNDIIDEFDPYPQITHKLNNDIVFDKRYNDLVSFVKSKEILIDLDEPEVSNDLSQQLYSKAKFMGFHCQGQREISLDKLAPTIRSEHHGNIEFRRLSKENGGIYTNELIKGLKERRLTLRECARIQTFPDDFNFIIPNRLNSRSKYIVSPSVGYKLVGNAVPPLLAYHIAKKIEKNWSFYFKKD